MYQVEFLSLAQQDMIDIARYISHTLSNPTAAIKLTEQMISAADSLIEFPYICPAYRPIRPLDREYRKLLVENYILFYWVDENKKVVTIARVIYAGRNYPKML